MKGYKKQVSNKQNFVIKNSSLYALVIFLVIILIAIGVTFSYAFWTSTVTQTNKNEVSLGCLSFSFNDKDLNSNSTSISLTNAYPISDEKGITSTPYVFTITNTCSLAGKFDIYLHNLSTSTMDSAYIKGYLTDSFNTVIIEPSLVSNYSVINLDSEFLSSVTSNIGTVNETYILHSVTLQPEESATYNFRLWIDYDAPNTIMGLTYNSALSVMALPAK